jgi:hypothetical protein
VLDIVNGLVVVHGFEGCPSCHQFVEQHSCRPDIYLLIVPSASEHFRSAVEERTGDGPHIEFGSPASVLAADAEVDQLDLPAFGVEEDVLHLDVAVGDRAAVEVGQRLQQLAEYAPQPLLATHLRPAQAGGEHQLHHQPAGVLHQVDVEGLIADDAGVGEGAEEEEVGLEFWQLLVVEHEGLDCVALARPALDAAVHHSVRPLSQLLHQLVLLGEELGVVDAEGAAVRFLLVVDALGVAGAVRGWDFVHADSLLDAGLVSADDGEGAE